MATFHEPRAMAEIRAVREALSLEMANLTPEEEIALFEKGVNEFEKKFGVKLKRQTTDDSDRFPGEKTNV